MERTDLKKLNGQNFVDLTDDLFFEKMVRHMLQDNDITVKNKIRVNSEEAALRMSLSGMGITVVLYEIIEPLFTSQNFNLWQIPKEILPLEVGVSYRNDAGNTVKLVSKELAKILPKLLKN